MPNPKVREVERLLFRNTQDGTRMVKRVRPVLAQINIQDVNFKPQHSAKSTQAWRYPKNRIVRAPSLWLGSTKYEDPKSPGEPRRKQESNFFITINTNKTSEDPVTHQQIYDNMERVLRHISKERVIATYLKYGPKDKEYLKDQYSDVVQSINWSSNVES